ncbi:MAG TPA: mechanosensitive ion channel domain-containing protein [Rhodanobacteraceae bacterium]|nr:mechanosensitive ion channel domain-containing protein [Rhodanobacteraceae bacterium]
MDFIHGIFAQPWARVALVLVAALVVAIVIFNVLRFAVRRMLRPGAVLATVLQRCERPFETLLPLLALQFALMSASLGLPQTVWFKALHHAVTVAIYVALTWLAIRAVSGVEQAINLRHPVNIEDNLRARQVQTQAKVLSRSAMFLIGVLGAALILMTFPKVQAFGASILASAGVAGLVVGLAARPVLGNLLAGLQIALAQPIRLDDVLIVQNEWGRVEEITGTFVVLKIWDERRLVIPLQWFIENPFQNWTRTSSQILGTVFLYVDYGLPVAPLRAELDRLVQGAPEWDKRVVVLQVTDADQRTMQLRILVSSRNSGLNFDLRCRVREGLIDFLQRNYPQHLSRLRVDTEPRDAPTGEPVHIVQPLGGGGSPSPEPK